MWFEELTEKSYTTFPPIVYKGKLLAKVWGPGPIEMVQSVVSNLPMERYEFDVTSIKGDTSSYMRILDDDHFIISDGACNSFILFSLNDGIQVVFKTKEKCIIHDCIVMSETNLLFRLTYETSKYNFINSVFDFKIPNKISNDLKIENYFMNEREIPNLWAVREFGKDQFMFMLSRINGDGSRWYHIVVSNKKTGKVVHSLDLTADEWDVLRSQFSSIFIQLFKDAVLLVSSIAGVQILSIDKEKLMIIRTNFAKDDILIIGEGIIYNKTKKELLTMQKDGSVSRYEPGLPEAHEPIAKCGDFWMTKDPLTFDVKIWNQTTKTFSGDVKKRTEFISPTRGIYLGIYFGTTPIKIYIYQWYTQDLKMNPTEKKIGTAPFKPVYNITFR